MTDDQRDRRLDRAQTLASAVGEVARNIIVAVAAARDLQAQPSKPTPRAGLRR
ncbi:MAG: hypothetical protein JWM87_723 [Candidatus Eremiobacteraeota bacterium]|nr:hypothetical protein [Candidatus Eremiobacteraeota bacterium]